MTDQRQHSIPAWLPLALLIIVTVGLFYRLLLGDVLFWGLPSLQFYPWREFAMSELAQGRLPLWNPYNGAGAPLLANYQSALLYPPHLLYFLFSGPQMMGWFGMLHILWAGLGMWLLTRRLGVPIIGQGIATLAYPLSNTIIARFGTFPMVDAAAWLPWLILATDMLLVKRDNKLSLWLRFAALTGVAAMLLLAGHAQWGFYSLLLAGGYAVWRSFYPPNPGPFPHKEGKGEISDKAKHGAELSEDQLSTGSPLSLRLRGGKGMGLGGIILFLLAFALAVGIASAQLIPTAELQHESQRASGVDEAFAFNFSYPPVSLITLLNPNFLGNPGDGSYVVPALYYEIAAYIGFLPMIIAIIGTFRYFLVARRKKQSILATQPLIPFFALVTLISILLAFGKFTPIFPFFYRHIPTFNLFQAPARWLLLAVFSLTMLAALATIDWQPDRRSRLRARLAVAGAIGLMILSGLALIITSATATAILAQLLRGLLTIGILALITGLLFSAYQRPDRRWTLAVLIFVAIDLWWANALSNPTVPASFYDKQPASTSTRLFLPDPKNEQVPQWVYDQFLTFKDYRVAVAQQAKYRQANIPDLNLLDRQPEFNSFEPLRPDGLDRYTNLLNKAPSDALLQNAAVGDVYGSDKHSAPSRVWLASEVRYANSLDEAETAMPTVPAGAALVTDQAAMLDHPGAGTAQITQETPLDLTIAVNAEQDALLVVADTYYPGWQATIDGAAVPIYRANLAFRAVKVPAGQHTIHMEYQPKSVVVGTIVSLISLIVLIFIVVVGLRQLRGNKP